MSTEVNVCVDATNSLTWVPNVIDFFFFFLFYHQEDNKNKLSIGIIMASTVGMVKDS